MSFLSKHASAAVFFALGVFVTGLIVATTLYADAQFGSQRQPRALTLRWVTERKELSPQAIAFVVAKCAANEMVVTGGYDLAIGGADPAKVYLLSASPQASENGYKLYVANGAPANSILVFSYAGCAPR